MHRSSRVMLGAVGLAAVVVLTGPVAEAVPQGPAAPVAAAVPAVSDARQPPLASSVLTTLAVKGRTPKTGYARSKYGAEWADLDHDGCWTREEILQRDLTKKTYKTSGKCKVIATGVLRDPYSGRTMTFTRGPRTSGLVQIDHVVALADSWQKGAQQLTAAQRVAFANDPLNLLAVDGRLNQQKGASDAATWLPPSKAYRCAYVARQIAVKARHRLWVTPAEKDAMARVLTSCPTQRIP